MMFEVESGLAARYKAGKRNIYKIWVHTLLF